MTLRAGRGQDAATLSGDAARVEAIVRALAASVNVRLLAVLAEERRRKGDAAWVHLSDAAARLDEAAGTVAAAVGRLQLAGLVDEKREKGRRYFRSRVGDLAIVLR